MTATTSPERISEAEAQIAALRAQRGAAALDGGDFDAAAYAAAEAQVEALRDAEGILVAREREGAAKARGARRTALKGIIEAEEKHRIESLVAAEEHARGLVAAIGSATEANAKISAAYHELTGRGSIAYQPLNFENRLSTYLSAVMRSLKDGPRGGRFGFITWPWPAMRQARDVWSIEEAKVVKCDLDQALK
jgi:hypothetical protein